MKPILNKSWIVAVLLSISAFAMAEHTITGRVVDETGAGLPGVNVIVKGTNIGTVTDHNGNYSIKVPNENAVLVFSFVGFVTSELIVSKQPTGNVTLAMDVQALQEVVVTGYAMDQTFQGRVAGVAVDGRRSARKRSSNAPSTVWSQPVESNTESYAGITENGYHDPFKDPYSTFSIDVDAASYSNVRRYINNGQTPPVDAVRAEEMINYFSYDYKQPTGEDPFSINTELSTAPWNPKHQLIHVGLQGKKIATDNLPPSNLVFLLDVSGSMSDYNKLPLVKSSLKLLVNQLREQDKISIVVYAGAAGLVLPPTSGADKVSILAALENLQAGGSTAGGMGIRLAYDVAKQNFVAGGNNRVILATDGDFNVGASSDEDMEKLIEEKRKDGVFLTVLGYGMGNIKDSKMEILADKGNGNYAYIDNILEAQKVLVNEFGGTLFTIASDVKLQVEFNPTKVKAYRLIGYENRLLKDEDFNNDRKDAGELGSGHTVTALYEIVPVGVEDESFGVDPTKYQKTKRNVEVTNSDELMTIKFRYKKPGSASSKLISHVVKNEATSLNSSSDNFRWSASVAAFAMLLRNSEYVSDFTYDKVLQLAEGARGVDKEGYRIEFINMVKTFSLVANR